MKRRRFLKTLAVAAPVAPVVMAQETAAPEPPPPASGPPPISAAPASVAPEPPSPFGPNATGQVPKLEMGVPDQGAEAIQQFFNDRQFATLRKLSDILLPSIDGAPGALDACAPEFLDFLIGVSGQDRQKLYKSGLDELDSQAKKHLKKPFAELSASEAGALMSPLRQPWTYNPAEDELARFLRQAKQDVRTAAMNSREWHMAAEAAGRRPGASGLYWRVIG